MGSPNVPIQSSSVQVGKHKKKTGNSFIQESTRPDPNIHCGLFHTAHRALSSFSNTSSSEAELQERVFYSFKSQSLGSKDAQQISRKELLKSRERQK